MPRGARLDAPGTLHHVMVRGIEGNSIVADDEDRRFFVSRMGKVAMATGTSIFAWALMTNHAHILLKSGSAGLSTFMRRLLTGYATGYNCRHKRHGHLFQNRFKSIVCEEEPYFLRLVSYIHLNPFRAGLVKSLEDLERYPWSGHAVVMNRIRNEWQDRDYVLGYFGQRELSARSAYQEFVAAECGRGSQPELTGGGLIRSIGGWSELKSLRKRQQKQFSDERILGSGEFAKEILDEADEAVKDRLPAIAATAEAAERLRQACEDAGVNINALQGGSRKQNCSELRKKLALEYVLELGMTYAGAARLLGISAAAVNGIVKRNEA
ncbi:MAG: transposase [Chlorobium sp.]|uniref:transposase n=1 Tax=Chlorobium sp. TaxID=1095 RepID=UPI0025BFF841|nr:transposase [Chlorobium sp.]MCF8217174.1 transposase [Chlorobium sp.]MCF8272021.1 transposase [Chlorobium sp.]MCF8288392.1 transposase [Chlorobium sp.]MCF8291990.1 transposase [Chlorobium sp.]MCF8386091.1 transposase [Chlorobium sp.]